MTLVTVEFTDKDIAISADTLLTSASRHGLERDRKEKSTVPGGLKLFILNGNYLGSLIGISTMTTRKRALVSGDTGRYKRVVTSRVVTSRVVTSNEAIQTT